MFWEWPRCPFCIPSLLHIIPNYLFECLGNTQSFCSDAVLFFHMPVPGCPMDALLLVVAQSYSYQVLPFVKIQTLFNLRMSWFYPVIPFVFSCDFKL